MPAVNTNVITESELDRIVRWRSGELERAGYSTDDAAALAARLEVNLHEAIDLVKDGCPPDIAVRILL
ncbi:MAG TPA: hypothetical protein VII05_03160 [Gaiellaceae bacterium]